MLIYKMVFLLQEKNSGLSFLAKLHALLQETLDIFLLNLCGLL